MYYTGGSISPKFKAILELLLGINWSNQRFKPPKLHQIPKKKVGREGAVLWEVGSNWSCDFRPIENDEFSEKTLNLYRS